MTGRVSRAIVFAVVLAGASVGAVTPMAAALSFAGLESSASPLAASTGGPVHWSHPWLAADPQAWLPVLFESQGPAAAVAVAKMTSDQSIALHPLGDADGDGAGDYLVESTVYDPEGPSSTTLVARSGADASKVLWTFQVPENGYWYGLGDVGADGVDDLVVHVSGESEDTYTGEGVLVAGVYTFTWSERGIYQLLDGATGKTLLEQPSEWKLEMSSAYASAIVAGASQYSFVMEGTSIERVGLGDWKGVDLVRFTSDWRHTGAGAGVYPASAGGGLDQDLSGFGLTRYDERGEARWSGSWEFDAQYGMLGDASDYTGDGVPDLLFSAFGSSTYVYGSAALVGTVLEVPPAQPVRAFLVDGATGTTRWETETDRFMGEGGVLPAGELRPGKRDVFLITIGQEEADAFQSFGSRITVLDGATGAALRTDRWENEFRIAIEFADVDADGKGEVFVLSADASEGAEAAPESIEAFVARADYSRVWGLTPQQAEAFYFFDYPAQMPDFDGDGVPEVITFPEEASGEDDVIQALSGRDGHPLWSFRESEKMVAVDIVEDVTGDGGYDLMITWFDVPEKANEEGPSSTPGPPPGTTAGPDGPSEPQSNITDHPGFVELQRGSDLALVWKKQIHAPGLGANVSHVWAWASRVDDTNGDGSADILYTLDSPGCTMEIVEQEDGSVIARCELEEETERLNFGLLLDGANGAVLAAFPDAPPTIPATTPVEFGDAAAVPPATFRGHEEPFFLPGPAVGLLAVGLLAALAWRRRT